MESLCTRFHDGLFPAEMVKFYLLKKDFDFNSNSNAIPNMWFPTFVHIGQNALMQFLLLQGEQEDHFGRKPI